jgi:hypothetical protein
MCGTSIRDACGDLLTFTSVSVSYHDAGREDWAASYCPDCADEFLPGETAR